MSKINLLLIVTMGFFLSCSSRTNSDPYIVGSNYASPTKLVFDIDSLLNNESLDTIHIDYDWAIKKKNKRYQGLATKFLFSKLITNHNIDTTNKEVIFLCKDGYSARVPFYQLLAEKGYLVNKDVDSELQWDKEINERFGPGYLVWNIDKDEKKFSFPFAIVQIQIVDIMDEYRDAMPINVSQNILTGFSMFKKHCIKCHSVNRVGGRMGPELNTPMNVTEYWNPEHLERFILNPDNYRYNSKMPAFIHLTNSEVKSIVAYLNHMSKYKKL